MKIEVFAKTHLGITLFPYQIKFLEAMVKAGPEIRLTHLPRAAGIATFRKILAEYTKETK